MYQVAAAAGAAMLGAYFIYNQSTHGQELIISESMLSTNLTELIDATDKPEIKDQKDALINNLIRARQTGQTEKQAAWQSVIKTLNPEYYVARDNTKKFDFVTPHIKALAELVAIATADLNGELEDNPELAADVVQFIFKVSNYYSIASTLDPNNFDTCTTWLLKARDFIVANGLQDTLQHSIWHNLIGGHKSREYQMGRNLGRPIEAVDHFKEAVRIHREKLGSDLDNPNDIELRHVQMCLSSTMLQDAMWCVVNEGFISESVQLIIEEATSLLADLTPERLVLKNGTPDLYRRAGCLQATGYELILDGDFDGAVESMSSASRTMQEAIGTTGATGQLSAILNDEAGAWLALATFYPEEKEEDIQFAQDCLADSIQKSEGQFEQMYADNAKQMLNQIHVDPKECFYCKLAESIINPADPRPNIKRPRLVECM